MKKIITLTLAVLISITLFQTSVNAIDDVPEQGNVDQTVNNVDSLQIEEQDYEPSESELEEYFTIDQEDLIYSGNMQAPNIVLKEDAPNFRYHVDLEIVSANKKLIVKPINAGNYILRAVVSYSPAKTLLGEILFHKTKLLEFPFKIVPKDVNGFVLSELKYNGEAQYPKLYSNYKELIEGVDFKYSEVDSYPDDNHTDSGNAEGIITHKFDIELINYTVNNESSYTVEYNIGKRFLDIQDEINCEYTGDVILPELYAMNANRKINLAFDDYSFNTNQEEFNKPGDYTALVTLNNTFFYNNTINETDIDLTDDVYTISIPAHINKAVIEYDFDALYYNGQNQIPNIVFTDVKGNKINADPDNQHITIIGNPVDAENSVLYEWKEVGSYYINVAMDEETYSCYEWPEYIVDSENPLNAKIGYRINKSTIEFAGWDFDSLDTDHDGVVIISGSLLSVDIDFKYTMDGDTLCLEYNGFNPFLFRTISGYMPIPGAKYKYVNSDIIVKDVKRADYKYYPQTVLDELKLSVGTYNSVISLDHDSYGTNSATATFKVIPKPVTLNWTKTTIGISESNLNPECEIVGLSPIDELGFKLVKKDEGIDWETTDRVVVEFGNYYKYSSLDAAEPEVVAYYPVQYKPTEVGKYKVDVRNLVYRLSGAVDNNYILTGNTSIDYVIVDDSSVEKQGKITVGTINKVDKSAASDIKLNALTETEMLSVISKLAEDDVETAQELTDALNNNKNISIYLVAENLEDTSKIILPTNNCVVIDLQLYAYIEGLSEQYLLRDTGTYSFGVDVTLTKAQADALGYTPGKCFYIATYHGTDVTPSNTQMVEPIVSGTGESTTYTFKIRTNKFSDFAIYVGSKPVDIEINYEHIVPYTGA